MSKPPLWDVLRNARFDVYREAIGVPSEEEYAAAQIRALRDWQVPEEPELPGYLRGSEYHVRQIERQRLRALLTAEADRAERGEVEHG